MAPSLPVSESTLERIARAGYAVKGVLYVLIGWLAVQAAFGSSGETTGTQGAVERIAGGTLGTVLLVLVAAGLVAYTLWRFAQAVYDPERKGDDSSGVARRIGLAGSGVAYGLLALSAFRILFRDGSGGSGGSGGTDEAASTAMSLPGGVWLVGIAGLVVIGVGLYQLYRAWTASFEGKLKTGEMSAKTRRAVVQVSRFGIAARAVAFVISGGFVLHAALTQNPEATRGLGGALDALAAQPFGQILLGVVAVGLIAYGVYCFANARYRAIPNR